MCVSSPRRIAYPMTEGTRTHEFHASGLRDGASTHAPSLFVCKAGLVGRGFRTVCVTCTAWDGVGTRLFRQLGSEQLQLGSWKVVRILTNCTFTCLYSLADCLCTSVCVCVSVCVVQYTFVCACVFVFVCVVVCNWLVDQGNNMFAMYFPQRDSKQSQMNSSALIYTD